jgi:hypothetical protein
VSERAKVGLIGDLVGSKDAPDRRGVQADLAAALIEVNRRVPAVEELAPTIGDELQGVFADLPSAIRATLLLRLELLKHREVDIRFGIGVGRILVFPGERRITQDGPAWWSARAAIERVEEMAREPRTVFLRTRLELSEEETEISRGEAAALNAFLASRDAIVSQMTPRRRHLLLGLLTERRQWEMADEEGIYQSAVSQGLARSGGYAIVAAERELEGAGR